jgi:outer membrane receptor protein involved in Fe transport
MHRSFLITTRISVAVSLLLASASHSVADETKHADVHIGPQPLSMALREFSEQTGLQVGYASELAEGKQTQGVDGVSDPAMALDQLLASTGLAHSFVNQETVVIRESESSQAASEVTRDPGNSSRTRRPVLMAQNQSPASQVKSANEAGEEETEKKGKKPLEEIIVTGTNIRGIAPESSPIQMYTREDILQSGATTTEQFMRTLPQNFGGGSTEFTPRGLPGDADVTYNTTFATGANLRGLGSGATLTLLNGRRLAPTSRIGNFVDLSMIPVTALERIDVLSDGASAIYGGDAVAGVVNFVLRDDYEGAETSGRFGTVTQGKMNEYRFSQTVGTTWDAGNVLAVYEFYDREPLALSSRPAIPAPETIEEWRDFQYLLPGQKRHSALVSISQDAGESLKLSALGLYSERTAESSSVSSAVTVNQSEAKGRQLSLAMGAEYEFSPKWTATVDTNYGNSKSDDTALQIFPDLSDVGGLDGESDLWSIDVRVNGTLFALGAGEIRVAVGGQYREESLTSVDDSLDLVLNKDERSVRALYGEVFVPVVAADDGVPGVRELNVAGSVRLDEYSDFGSTVNPKFGLLWSPANGVKLRGSYSESFAPPPLGRTGDQFTSAQVAPFSFVLGLIGRDLPDPSFDGVDYVIANGTDPNLDPETSRTYTFGLDSEYGTGRHDFLISASYYDIEFEGRLNRMPIPLNQSVLTAPSIAWDDPGAFPEGTVIFFPTDDYIADFVASLVRPATFVAGASGFDNVGVVNNAGRVTNIASTRTKGLDFEIEYQLSSEIGLVTAGINANYIMEFSRQASDTTPEVETLNALLSPVDLKLRGNVGLSRGGLNANMFVNYVDSYRTNETDNSEGIDSWTTIDLTLGYAFQESARTWLNGTSLSLSVTNLLNEAPPITPTNASFSLPGYDQTNASPLMRFAAVEIRKAF